MYVKHWMYYQVAKVTHVAFWQSWGKSFRILEISFFSIASILLQIFVRKAVDLVFNWCGFCLCFLTILKLKKNQNLNYLKLRSSVVSPPRCSDNVLKLSHLLACFVEALGFHVWSGCSLHRPWHHVPEVGLHPWTMFCVLTTYYVCWVEFEKWWLECENWSGKVGSLNTSLRQKLQRSAEEERREIVTERRGSLALVKRELNSGTVGQCVKTWASASSLNSGLCTFAQTKAL